MAGRMETRNSLGRGFSSGVGNVTVKPIAKLDELNSLINRQL